MAYTSSALQGMGAGAAVGSAVGPVGALVGGGLGALAGLFSAYEEEQDTERKRRLLDQIKKQYNLDQDAIEKLMTDYYSNPENFLGTSEDVAAYRQTLSSYNPEDYVYDFGSFGDSYDKAVDDFVNPYYDRIIDATAKQAQHTAAGAGVGRGTGAVNSIAEAVAQKNDELYKTALGQYNTDRSQSYSEWAGNIDRMQNRLNQLRAATDTKLNNLGSLAQDYTDTQKQQVSDLIAAKQNRANGNLSLASTGLML